jgi:hypothetical protein
MGYYYFEKPKNMDLPKPNITMALKGNLILIRSDVLVKDLCLDTENELYKFNDNYFDLMPGEEKWIAVKSATQNKIDLQKIRLKSLKNLASN